jgi:DNA-binding NarL/FixJ family response regulator
MKVMQQVNVLLIGDEDRRRAVKEGLRGQEQIRLAGEIAESQALPLVPQLQADVIVLDFSATRVNGVAALPWLATLPGEPAVIVLGASGIPAERRLAMDLGARDYLPPDSPVQVLGGLVAATVLPPSLPFARAA